MTEREYVVHEELSPWPWWAAGIVALCVVAVVVATFGDVLRGVATGRPDLIAPGLLVTVGTLCVAVAIRTLFGRMRTTVTRTSVKLTYGYTRLIEKLITFDEIDAVEPVRYSPMREFGGWGIRFGSGGKKAWTVRGDGAVVLTLDDGTLFYVGSEHPQRLAQRIRTAMESRRKTRSSSTPHPTGTP